MGNTSSTKSPKRDKITKKKKKKLPEKDAKTLANKTNKVPAASATETLHSKLNVTDHTGDGNRDVFDYYEKVKVIGEGSTCKIYAVRRKGETKNEKGDDDDDDNLLALKEIAKDQVDGVFLEELRNEVAILRTLDHPNIVRVYEIFESKRAIYLVMEYCSGGDLYARIPYTEDQVAKIMTKLLSAVVYIHKHKIIHRDIKMENIMLESDKPDAEAKLIDFGLSRSYLKPTSQLSDIVGTVYSMSPQVIRKQYTSKADLWACGVVAFILLSNKWPFDGSTRSSRKASPP